MHTHMLHSYLSPAVFRDLVPAEQISTEVHPQLRAAASVWVLRNVGHGGRIVAVDHLILIVELLMQADELAVGSTNLLHITTELFMSQMSFIQV